MIEVYDNFLPTEFSDELLQLHTDGEFSWFLQKSTINTEKDNGVGVIDENTIDSPQLCHTFFNLDNQINSPHFNEVVKILDYLPKNRRELIRIKSNLNLNYTNYSVHNYQPRHLDMTIDNYNSLLYYINDSDGDTLFFKDDTIVKKVAPKKNRAVYFNSSIEHAGTNPIKSSTRIVINFIFKNVE